MVLPQGALRTRRSPQRRGLLVDRLRYRGGPAQVLVVLYTGASSWHVDATAHATGIYAVAETNAEATKPSEAEIRVTGPAPLSGLAQWSIECNTNSGAAGKTKTGKVTLKFPGTELLKVPAKSSLCAFAANVQIQGSGKVTISIESK